MSAGLAHEDALPNPAVSEPFDVVQSLVTAHIADSGSAFSLLPFAVSESRELMHAERKNVLIYTTILWFVDSANMVAPRGKIGLLSSWKEIAAYLGRGVRTVQRYEKMGLPVRRLNPGRRSSVVAQARDIDAWLQSAQAHGFSIRQSSDQLIFRGALVASVQQARLLRDELMQLRESQDRDLAKLFATISRLEKLCTPVDDSATRTAELQRRKNARRRS